MLVGSYFVYPGPAHHWCFTRLADLKVLFPHQGNPSQHATVVQLLVVYLLVGTFPQLVWETFLIQDQHYQLFSFSQILVTLHFFLIFLFKIDLSTDLLFQAWLHDFFFIVPTKNNITSIIWFHQLWLIARARLIICNRLFLTDTDNQNIKPILIPIIFSTWISKQYWYRLC